MLAAMLFAISIVALTQFAAYYWRAMLAGTAAQPVSERVLLAAGSQNGLLTGEDFPALVGIHELTPELGPGGNGLSLVRVYYRLVDAVASLAGSSMPGVGAWTQRELAGLRALRGGACKSTAAYRPISSWPNRCAPAKAKHFCAMNCFSSYRAFPEARSQKR